MANKDYVAGSSSLVLGCDSYTSPAELGDTEYVAGQNVVCRGGILQTRPGSRSLFCLPDGNFQGVTLFTPDNGVAQLVAAVDGKIYVSAFPFTSYRRLWNLQFSPSAKYLAWASCLKSTDFDNEGNLVPLDNPYSVLIMQDGLTRAAYWDGGTSAHINPGPPPYPDNTDNLPGYTGTVIGLWMIWAGNRLWVSRGNQVFASDIGNPLKFTEATYLNEGRAFYLSGPCTGFVASPDQQGIIAFTENDGTFFQSAIQDRTLWLSTPEFQKTVLPNVGCVAPRSLITQYGLNWWFSARGLTNFNAALRLNITSRIDYQDNQMFSSKAYLGPDLSGICAGYYENLLMCSVPSGDVLNRHTWVLDQAPFEGNANAWTGFWSGWRPIEWTKGVVNGNERVFFGSIDYDGKNRIWEGMLEERKDNGCAITCYAQLRDHAAGNLDQKRYEWTKFFLSQIYGDVDLNVYVASTKGGYQLQKGYHLVATEGQIFADQKYSEVGPLMVGNRVQSRTIRTPSDPEDNECNSCGVESKEGNKIDYAFSHLLVWSGQMGIRAYQIHMRESPERQAGDCEEPEVGPRTLNAQGCSGLALLVDGQVFEQFTANAEGVAITVNGGTAYIRQTVVSPISQENAQALAECRVQQIINAMVDRELEPGVYNSGSAEMGSNESFVVVSGPITPPNPEPPPGPYDVDYLLIAGGGGGGATTGFAGGGGCGGGGGGGLKTGASTLTPGVTYPVVVGAGGPAAPKNTSAEGTDGSNSTFDSDAAIGGGGGGGSGFGIGGKNGGCGGGGAGFGSNGPGGIGSQGGNGGNGRTAATDQGGGGGGAGGIGTDGGGGHGGAGGPGLSNSLSGAPVTYAGGAGGGYDNVAVAAPGGSGGGGAGATSTAPGVNGTPNLGGGGGGGSIQQIGGDGGDGVVIISYPGAQRGTGGVVTSVGGNTIHTFTTSEDYVA